MTGALTVLMKDAIKPNLMQTLEVSSLLFFCIDFFSCVCVRVERIHTCVCRSEVDLWYYLSPRVLSTLVFETGSFTSLELAKKARLTG